MGDTSFLPSVGLPVGRRTVPGPVSSPLSSSRPVPPGTTVLSFHTVADGLTSAEAAVTQYRHDSLRRISSSGLEQLMGSKAWSYINTDFAGHSAGLLQGRPDRLRAAVTWLITLERTAVRGEPKVRHKWRLFKSLWICEGLFESSLRVRWKSYIVSFS